MTKKNTPVGKPFTKDDPRINRKGRKPRGMTYAEYVRAFIEEDDGGKKKSIIQEMTEIAVQEAKKGSFVFWQEIKNNAYGKVPDKVELQNEEKPDLSKLTKEELEVWMQLLQKARPSQ